MMCDLSSVASENRNVFFYSQNFLHLGKSEVEDGFAVTQSFLRSAMAPYDASSSCQFAKCTAENALIKFCGNLRARRGVSAVSALPRPPENL